MQITAIFANVQRKLNAALKASALALTSALALACTYRNEGHRVLLPAGIELKPGEKRTVSFSLKGSDLAFVGADGKWILEKGKFRMQAGDKILYMECTETHKWDTQNK